MNSVRALFDPEITEEEGFLDWFVGREAARCQPGRCGRVRAHGDRDRDHRREWLEYVSQLWSCTGNRIVSMARHVAARIPDATIVELGGDGVWLYADDVAEAVLSFLRGEAVPSVARSSVLGDCPLHGHCRLDAARGGARRPRLACVACSNVITLRFGASSRGTGVPRSTWLGTGSFAASMGQRERLPAHRVVEGANELGIEVRAGIHTGECELVGEKIAGIAVVTGSRHPVSRCTRRSTWSSTVKYLVAGSGFSFVERGDTRPQGCAGRVEALRGRLTLRARATAVGSLVHESLLSAPTPECRRPSLRCPLAEERGHADRDKDPGISTPSFAT